MRDYSNGIRAKEVCYGRLVVELTCYLLENPYSCIGGNFDECTVLFSSRLSVLNLLKRSILKIITMFTAITFDKSFRSTKEGSLTEQEVVWAQSSLMKEFESDIGYY